MASPSCAPRGHDCPPTSGVPGAPRANERTGRWASVSTVCGSGGQRLGCSRVFPCGHRSGTTKGSGPEHCGDSGRSRCPRCPGASWPPSAPPGHHQAPPCSLRAGMSCVSHCCCSRSHPPSLGTGCSCSGPQRLLETQCRRCPSASLDHGHASVSRQGVASALRTHPCTQESTGRWGMGSSQKEVVGTHGHMLEVGQGCCGCACACTHTPMRVCTCVSRLPKRETDEKDNLNSSSGFLPWLPGSQMLLLCLLPFHVFIRDTRDSSVTTKKRASQSAGPCSEHKTKASERRGLRPGFQARFLEPG